MSVKCYVQMTVLWKVCKIAHDQPSQETRPEFFHTLTTLHHTHRGFFRKLIAIMLLFRMRREMDLKAAPFT